MFRSSQYHVGLMMSVDWFRPYLTFQERRGLKKVDNHCRYNLDLLKILSFIIVIIPGPHEPSININTFLHPLRNYGRVWNLINHLHLWAALVAVTSDLPALRKITHIGCSRCKFQAEREPGTRGASGKMSYYTTRRSTARDQMSANKHSPRLMLQL